MRRTAVIFMLIFTILAAYLCTGCGANSSAPKDNQESDANAPKGNQEGDANASKGDRTDNTTAPEDTTDSASSIPDTDESAASTWGTAKAEDSSDPAAKAAASEGDSESGFSKVIADNGDLYFAVKKVIPDGSLGYTWKVYIENRTDKNLMFSFEKVSVNNVMCDPYWAEVITAGRKGNCEITWMRDALQERGIEEIVQVDFTLNVYNEDDYTEAPLMHDPFTVCPLGEDRAESAAIPREPVDTDLVLVDSEDCSFIVTGYEPDNSWGYGMRVFLENKTDRELVFSVSDTSVNGYMCDPFWAEIVSPGKTAISTVLWDKNALDENDITEVKEISLPLCIYADSDIANPYVDETFELTPGKDK